MKDRYKVKEGDSKGFVIDTKAQRYTDERVVCQCNLSIDAYRIAYCLNVFEGYNSRAVLLKQPENAPTAEQVQNEIHPPEQVKKELTITNATTHTTVSVPIMVIPLSDEQLIEPVCSCADRPPEDGPCEHCSNQQEKFKPKKGPGLTGLTCAMCQTPLSSSDPGCKFCKGEVADSQGVRFVRKEDNV